MNRKTVERIFEKNYQTALKLEYIRKPYAWALYQTWEEVDKKGTRKMTVCKEMQKLRKVLDIMGIEWVDKSEEWQAADFIDWSNFKNYGICRTHFDYNGKHYSVINGFGSFGGYDEFDKENKNLLEIMLPNNDVIGYLTAKEVLEIIEENKNEQRRINQHA